MGSVQLLNVPEVTVKPTMLLEQLLADTPDFIENGIRHG